MPCLKAVLGLYTFIIKNTIPSSMVYEIINIIAIFNLCHMYVINQLQLSLATEVK